ncbi:uncharacterized protein LOC112010297 [Quercus suber]|uniref:uncharacterized protein LOC112010297 n=1 Tax=Quercus suber TaxID=58331 RepID=UPI000CE17BE4|nr:uncharacterized protein LOC112010297 [Quercus suber]
MGWNWARIPFELPQCIKKEIQATPFALTGTSQDRLIWMGSRDGEFDLKSAYRQCYHDSIGVKDRLVARGLVVDLTCPLCHSDVKTISHALKDCLVSIRTWNDIGIPSGSNTFFSQNLHTWLAENCTVERRNNSEGKGIFLLCLFSKGGSNSNSETNQATRGWVKLNTDSLSLGNPSLAEGGGVIRDEEGNWLVGFARNIGITTSFQAELWGQRDGLTLCVEHNFSAVEVELDARAVLDVITSPVCSNSLITSLVNDCKQLASRIPQLRLNHCYCDANRSADKFARMGAVQKRPFAIFLSSPVDAAGIFRSKMFGVTMSRVCPEAVVSV